MAFARRLMAAVGGTAGTGLGSAYYFEETDPAKLLTAMREKMEALGGAAPPVQEQAPEVEEDVPPPAPEPDAAAPPRDSRSRFFEPGSFKLKRRFLGKSEE